LKGFDEGGQHGIVAPAAVPNDILAKLHAAIVSAMRSPEIANHLANEGSVVVASTPDEYRALIRRKRRSGRRSSRRQGSNRSSGLRRACSGTEGASISNREREPRYAKRFLR